MQIRYALVLVIATSALLAGCTLSPKLLTGSPASPTPVSTPAPTPTPIPELTIIPAPEEAMVAPIPELLSATLHVPGSENKLKIKLVNGKGTAKKGNERTSAVLTGPYHQFKYTDDSMDYLGVSNFNFGGSGEQQYVVLLKEAANQLINTSAWLVGDRIKVINLEVEPQALPDSYNVIVSYYDRGADEPMVNEPTVPRQVTISVVDHLLEGGDVFVSTASATTTATSSAKVSPQVTPKASPQL